MNELIRVYRGKNPVIIMLVLLSIGMFLISCKSCEGRAVTLTGAELESYISSYPEFISRTAENAEALGRLPMYSGNGFGAQTVKKSAEKYGRLSGITLEGGNNFGIIMLLNFGLSDILLSAFLTAAALGFHTERRKGLVNMVRTAVYGRGRLCVCRMIILFISAVLGGIFLYGGNFLGMTLLFGESGLSRALQSLPEFARCPYKVTVGEYLLVSFGMKVWAAFITALLFYLLTSLFGTAAAFGAAGVLGAAQMLLHVLLIPVSGVNFLKYINIFAAFDLEGVFAECRFVNIFGNAADSFYALFTAMTIVTVLLCVLLWVIHGKLPPVSQKSQNSIIGRLAALGEGEKIKITRSIFGWEMRKILISCKGAVFLSAALLLTLYSAGKYDYAYPVNPYEAQWYSKFEGTITEEMIDNISLTRRRLEQGIERTNDLIEKTLAKEHPDNDLLGRLYFQLNEYTLQLEGLLPVQQNAEDGLAYTRESGRQISLIKPYAYELLFKKDTGTVRRVSLYALIGVISALSGLYAYDRQSGMGTVIRSAYKGRKALNAAKLSAAGLICFLTCSGLHLVQLWQIGDLLGLENLSEPLQSLECMRSFPVYMTVLEFIIFLFAARGLAGCAAGAVCALISRLSPDTGTAMGISAFLLVIPGVAAQISESGLPDMIYFLSGSFIL